jgi:hypothetical protein
VRVRSLFVCIFLFALLILFHGFAAIARAQEPGPKVVVPPGAPPKVSTKPEVQDLGDGRYRVGVVEVDKAGGTFRAPGHVIRDASPLEFLAISRGGNKAYESLLEIDATAFEFNLACILIGLNSDKAEAARFHFDPNPTQGDAVEVFVEWQSDGGVKRVDAAELLVAGEKKLAPSSWVYTGSTFTPSGDYLAHLDGTLIGFVHDPASVIEHRTGFIGSFGSIEVDKASAPAVDTQITLIVERKATSPGDESDSRPQPPGRGSKAGEVEGTSGRGKVEVE